MTIWHDPKPEAAEAAPAWAPLLAVVCAIGLLLAAAVLASLAAPWS